MSHINKQQVHAGHTIKLKIDGLEVGRAQSVDGRRSFGQEGVYELGSIMPQEHVALRYEGSVTLDKFRIRTKSLKEIGLASYGVGILNMDVIDIEITDRYTGDIIVNYKGCSLQDYSENFRANAISGENATWTYLYADRGTEETVSDDSSQDLTSNFDGQTSGDTNSEDDINNA